MDGTARDLQAGGEHPGDRGISGYNADYYSLLGKTHTLTHNSYPYVLSFYSHYTWRFLRPVLISIPYFTSSIHLIHYLLTSLPSRHTARFPFVLFKFH